MCSKNGIEVFIEHEIRVNEDSALYKEVIVSKEVGLVFAEGKCTELVPNIFVLVSRICIKEGKNVCVGEESVVPAAEILGKLVV